MAVRVGLCSPRQVLEPCELEGFHCQVDPYIGCEHHCYYCYALNQAETCWEEETLIHQNIAGTLSRELSLLEPQAIYIGWNTDPYQPSEAIHQQTRQVLELLAQRDFSVCILTKSDLVVRDIGLLAKMKDSSVGISIAFQDDDVRRLFEAHAPPNEGRIEALKRLKDAGIETYTLICPVVPFVTEVEPLIELVAPYADTIWFYGLSMEDERGRNWQNVKAILDHHFPEMTEQCRQIAFSADHPYWTELRARLEQIQLDRGLNLRIEL
jgi:DNA repair photolyase